MLHQCPCYVKLESISPFVCIIGACSVTRINVIILASMCLDCYCFCSCHLKQLPDLEKNLIHLKLLK